MYLPTDVILKFRYRPCEENRRKSASIFTFNLFPLQRRFPDLNITEEDLINAEKELEEMTKESDEKKSEKEKSEAVPALEEEKKTL